MTPEEEILKEEQEHQDIGLHKWLKKNLMALIVIGGVLDVSFLSFSMERFLSFFLSFLFFFELKTFLFSVLSTLKWLV